MHLDRWSTQIAERIKLSPPAGAWYSEFGGLNRWCHIWAYKDAAERFASANVPAAKASGRRAAASLALL